ncbi:MAG: esterase-like activity of phytase family protein, partial [Anaerolineae bacterium]|nr:esterase-like activity of phytase family protein [Anaerolineae bacterium]
MPRSPRRSLPLIALVVILLSILLPAASLAQGPDTFPASAPATAPDLTNNISLNLLGRYAGIGAEIAAYDPATKRLYVTGPQLQIVDISNPVTPTLVTTVAVDATSVAAKSGILAAAVPANPVQDPGQVVFLSPDGTILTSVTVGALPDMLTFTPDGKKVLVANEGEPGAIDPEGSVSVIDISAGVAAATVATASFTAFNDRRAELVNRGVRIFPSAASVAQDLEPEYIAVASDGKTARVTLQEANAIAVLDIASATITQILPLGLKDHRGMPWLTTYQWQGLPVLGQAPSALAGADASRAESAALPDAPAGVQISLGGFSGLFFEGKTAAGALEFVTHTDRGPNGEPTDLISHLPGNERPFAMPKFQPELVRFELDPDSGVFTITQRIGLVEPNGVKMTGLPNLQAGAQGTAYTDEVPVDLFGNQLANRPLGIDPEGVVVAPDGTFWMVEEYRVSILHFDAAGKLLARYVPQGTAASVGAPAGTFGVEALPAVYAQRRANRGFEGIALDGSTVYAFIQSALDNPDTANDATSRASRNLRIVEFDTTSQTVTAEYLYNLRDISGAGAARTDKIGDAASLGNGRFAVMERDDRLGMDANKLVYEVDLRGATDIHNPANLGGAPAGKTLEQLTESELAAAGIKPVFKRLVTNLAALGYTGVSKPEGLAVVDGETLAVINDNDFGILAAAIPGDGTLPMNPNPEPVLLGLVRFSGPSGLDASDRDGAGGGKTINIQPWPVFGMYMPDGIAAFSAGSQVFYATANEGDARGEPARISSLNLDPTAFPNAAELKNNAALGRLNASSMDGDVDGDGDYDRLYSYGSRSFTIWDAAGNQVFDSGDAFEQITAAQTPVLFNANDGDPAKWDERSDDKGPEPEGVTVGTIAGRPYAFVGLERAGGGVMVYDLGNPRQPLFMGYYR